VLARLLGVDPNNAWLLRANFLWGVGSGLYAAIWPLFIESLGASPAEIGLAISLTSAVKVVVLIPAAGIAGRFGRKQAMLLGWLMGPASSVVFALATSWEHLLPGIVLLALVALCSPAYLGYIASAAGGHDLPRIYTLMGAAVAAGTVISSPLGGWLAELVDMRWLFWLVAAAYAASTACVGCLDNPDRAAGADAAAARALPQTRPEIGVSDDALPRSEPAEPFHQGSAQHAIVNADEDPPAVQPAEPSARGAGPPPRAGYAAVLTNRGLMVPMVMQLALVAAANLAQPLAANWLAATYGYSRGAIGVLGAVTAAATVGWGLALGRVANRKGPAAALLVAAALVVCGGAALLVAASPLMGAVAYAFRGAFAALQALCQGVVAGLLRPATGGIGGHSAHLVRGFAVYSVLLNLALTASTLAAGALYQAQAALPFALSAAAVLPVALLLWATTAGQRRGQLGRAVARPAAIGGR
jgi:MFS family permease